MAKLYLHVTYLAIIIYVYEALARTGLLHDSHIGNHHAMLSAEVQFSTGKHTGTYLLVLVTEHQLYGEGMSSRIDGRILERYGSSELLAWQGIEGDDGLVALLYLGVVVLRYVDEQLHGANLLHGEDGCTGIEITIVIVAGSDDTVDGAQELGILHDVVVLALSHLERHLHVVKLSLRHTAYGIELLHAGEVYFLILNLQGQLLQVGSIHLHELLSFAYVVAHLYKDLVDTTGSLRSDVVFHLSLYGTYIVAHLIYGAHCHLSHLHGGLHLFGFDGSLCCLTLAATSSQQYGHGHSCQRECFSFHLIYMFCLIFISWELRSSDCRNLLLEIFTPVKIIYRTCENNFSRL